METPPSSPIPPQPTPAPPSPEERELYYYHLFPSCPPLLARSSTYVWENPQRPGSVMYPSGLSFKVRDRLLAQLWRDAQSGLISRFIEATEDVFNTMDIFRVYINDEYHETLMISVDPDSMSWERGYAIAMRCKAVLEEYDIHNVHCEIRESVIL